MGEIKNRAEGPGHALDPGASGEAREATPWIQSPGRPNFKGIHCLLDKNRRQSQSSSRVNWELPEIGRRPTRFSSQPGRHNRAAFMIQPRCVHVGVEALLYAHLPGWFDN